MCPDWYPDLRACRYLGIDFCAAMELPYGPVVRGWALMAEAAENEAAAELRERAAEAAAG